VLDAGQEFTDSCPSHYVSLPIGVDPRVTHTAGAAAPSYSSDSFAWVPLLGDSSREVRGSKRVRSALQIPQSDDCALFARS